MPVSSSIAEDGTTVTIRVAGRFDDSTHREFQRSYQRYPRGEKRFVVDLAATDYLDSPASGMLPQLREYAAGSLSVERVNGNAAIDELLRIANFDKLFKIPGGTGGELTPARRA